MKKKQILAILGVVQLVIGVNCIFEVESQADTEGYKVQPDLTSINGEKNSDLLETIIRNALIIALADPEVQKITSNLTSVQNKYPLLVPQVIYVPQPFWMGEQGPGKHDPPPINPNSLPLLPGLQDKPDKHDPPPIFPNPLPPHDEILRDMFAKAFEMFKEMADKTIPDSVGYLKDILMKYLDEFKFTIGEKRDEPKCNCKCDCPQSTTVKEEEDDKWTTEAETITDTESTTEFEYPFLPDDEPTGQPDVVDVYPTDNPVDNVETDIPTTNPVGDEEKATDPPKVGEDVVPTTENPKSTKTTQIIKVVIQNITSTEATKPSDGSASTDEGTSTTPTTVSEVPPITDEEVAPTSTDSPSTDEEVTTISEDSVVKEDENTVPTTEVPEGLTSTEEKVSEESLSTSTEQTTKTATIATSTAASTTSKPVPTTKKPAQAKANVKTNVINKLIEKKHDLINKIWGFLMKG